MALGAIELFRASGEPQDLADALDWIRGHELGGSITWEDVGALAAAEFCGVLGLPAPSPEAAAVGCGLLRSAAEQAAQRAQIHALATAGTLAFGTTAEHGGAGAVLALAGAAGFEPGRSLAADARDWVLGRNPWGKSFVAGLGPGAPVQVHHLGRGGVDPPRSPARSWAARPRPRYCASSAFGFRKGPFDGPAGVYQDKVSNYVTSEVALDYAASTLLLLATMAPPG